MLSRILNAINQHYKPYLFCLFCQDQAALLRRIAQKRLSEKPKRKDPDHWPIISVTYCGPCTPVGF